MNELHLFAGAGGGILAGQLLGHRCVGAVENEPYAQAVLVARQNDGTFPPFPVFGDVCEFDGRPWRGIVDIVAGGFPCQDISAAGSGAGIEGERSGLWSEMARIVREVRPRFVFVENSPMLTSRGLGVVLGDLATMGFDAEWCVLGADDVGAPHRRKRIWILAESNNEWSERRQQQPGSSKGAGNVAHADSKRQPQSQGSKHNQRGRVSDGGEDVANAGRRRRRGQSQGEIQQPGRAETISASDVAHATGQRRSEGRAESARRQGGLATAGGGDSLAHANGHELQGLESESQPGRLGRPAGLHGGAWSVPPWPDDPADAPESPVGRVVAGMAHRSHRIKALGNGQVPRVAAAAFVLLEQRLGTTKNMRIEI